MTRRGWRASYAVWRALRLVAAGLLCAIAIVGPAGPASAHATLIGTDPADGAVLDAAPAEATFTFDEGVSLPPDGVTVYDAAGDPIDASARTQDAELTVDLPDRLADGTYVVTWRVVSADGHPVAGSLTFSVGAASAVVTAPVGNATSDGGTKTPLSIVQGFAYLGLLLAAGLTVFLVLLLPEDAKAAQGKARVVSIRQWAAAIAAIATLLTLPVSSGYQRGLGFGEAMNPTNWAAPGTNDLVAAGLVLAGLLIVLGAPVAGPSARSLPLIGVAALVTAPALAGHSRAFAPQALVLGTDIAHLLAGSIWLGGLVGVALTLPALAGRGDRAAALVSRFSTAAASTLTALVASGALLAWRIVGSWGNLFDTGYGRLLVVKITIVAVAVGVAAWNRFALLPRVRLATGFGDLRAAAATMRRTVSLEAGVLVAVLALTGFLANQAPRPEAPAVAEGRTGVACVAEGRTGVASGVLGDVKVLGTLAPRTRGQNTLLVQLQDASGEPVEYAAAPTVSVRSGEVDLGEVPVRSVAAGTVEADVLIPTDGVWEVSVGLRLSRFDNPVTTLEFDVPAG